MFQRKRQLKKDKKENRIKFVFKALVTLLILLFVIEFAYLHFSFGKITYLSPIAQNKNSQNSLLENKLQKANISFIALSSNPDGSSTIMLKDGGEIILSSKKDIGSQISSLQLILSKLTIEGKRLKILDFRFDNPVVSF
jgi:hypothetical protein